MTVLTESLRCREIARGLGLVEGRTYELTIKRGGVERQVVGRFVRIGNSSSGSVVDGIHLKVPDSPAFINVYDRALVRNVEEVIAATQEGDR